MNESFTVERTDIKSLLSNYNLSIPPFQRKFVWNGDKKRELIDSLNRSFPIGAITLFLNKKDNCYLIVDGLQRINTIKAYLINPCSIVPFRQYFEKIKGKVLEFASKYDIKEAKIGKSIKKWYESLDTASNATSFKYKDFSHLQKCLEENKLNAISTNLALFQELRNILLEPIDIEGENIGLISYKGNLDDLPDLFSKINQKNISLTGYEILHSLWYNYTIPVDAGFQKYFDAFKKLANKSEGYVELDDNYFDTFNMYMNISSLEEIILDETDESIKAFLSSKGNFQVFKSETVFDIFSTICSKTTNLINKSVEQIFSRSDSIHYDYILALNEAIVSVSLYLNQFLKKQSIAPYSKYFYIYFFYYVFINKYYCDTQNSICRLNEEANLDEEQMLKDIVLAKKEKWFIDENRQLSFFAEKIKTLTPQKKEPIT